MEYKRLYRSETNKVIAGVAGGLGEYFDIDPVVVRVLFAVMFFLGGGGLLIYIILWIAVPMKRDNNIFASQPSQQPQPEAEYKEPEVRVEDNNTNIEKRPHRGSFFGAIILITLGMLFLADSFTEIHFGKLWPVILIVIGILMLTNVTYKKNNSDNK
jgi:phage shock protein C